MSKTLRSSSTRRWGDLLGRQERSGLSVAAFCEREELAVSTFYFWRRRLRGSARGDGPARGDLRRDNSDTMFVELTPSRRAAAASASEDRDNTTIELVLARGVTIRVRPGFDALLLRQVIEALQ